MADQNVETCLRMLKKASTDNEKFAGIMMVTKVVKAENCDSSMKQELAEAIGLKFLARLIRSTTVPEGCPTNIYKSLALDILSTICTDPVVAGMSEMKSLVSALNEILLSPPSSEEDKTVLDGCYQCLYGLACCKEGQLCLIQGNTVSCLVQAVIQQADGHPTALEILLMIAGCHGNNMWLNQKATCDQLIAHLSTQFIEKKDTSKFDVCRNLVSFISTHEKVQGSDIELNASPWLIELVSVLAQDIQNKLGVDQRQWLLLLICELVEKFSILCLLPPYTSNCKLLLIVTHLVCIEVRMILENSTWQEMKEKTSVLCSCYLLLENIISHMTTGQPMGFEEKQVLQVHTSMVGAFNAILFFLDEISAQKNKKWLDVLVTASIRVLGAWLAEETTALKHNIYKLLPFIIQLIEISLDPKLAADLPEVPTCVESNLQECDNLQSQSVKAIEDTESQSGSVSEQMETDQSNASEPVKRVKFSLDVESNDNVDILRFLLPGLCHLSSEEEPRKILIDNNIQKLLLKYLKIKWQIFLEVDDNKEDVKDTLSSLCGVYLNLTVTEPLLVQTDLHFHSLLQLLFTTLPRTIYKRENLILTANFTVLGLMLLQHHPTGKSDKEEERNKFLSHCISFFSHTFLVKPTTTNNQPQVVVSDDYQSVWQDISELWFLGIQALCACIKNNEEIPNIILKSGWISVIVKMLLDVADGGIEEDIVSVYIQLLITLCNTNQSCKQIVFEKGGLQLARRYRSTELEGVLSS